MKIFKKLKDQIEYRIFLLQDYFYHKKITRAIKRHDKYTSKLFIEQNNENENY